MKGEGELQKGYIRFSHHFGFKKQKIYLRDFKKDVDVNFTHFSNLKFVYFEMELGKLTKWLISLANFHFGHLKGARFKYRFYFRSLCV